MAQPNTDTALTSNLVQSDTDLNVSKVCLSFSYIYCFGMISLPFWSSSIRQLILSVSLLFSKSAPFVCCLFVFSSFWGLPAGWLHRSKTNWRSPPALFPLCSLFACNFACLSRRNHNPLWSQPNWPVFQHEIKQASLCSFHNSNSSHSVSGLSFHTM